MLYTDMEAAVSTVYHSTSKDHGRILRPGGVEDEDDELEELDLCFLNFLVRLLLACDGCETSDCQNLRMSSMPKSGPYTYIYIHRW